MMYVATPEQLYKGVCHVNIGKSTTTITVSQGGKVLSSVSLSIGGEHVTEEISEAFQIEKSEAWQTAIGLQAVDGLKTSAYLLDTAKEHIEGKISIDEAQKRIQSYYEQRTDVKD